MLMRFLTRSFLLCFLGCGGCGPSQPAGSTTVDQTDGASVAAADPHDIPLTDEEINQLREETAVWNAALERMQKLTDTIKMETASGMPAKAHRALDLVDYVLQWLPDIAQASNVPKDHWQAIGENTQTLRDAFNVVHTNIDAGKQPSYETVAAEIRVAVAALAAIKSGPSEDRPVAE